MQSCQIQETALTKLQTNFLNEIKVVDVNLLNDKVKKNIKDFFEIVNCNNVSYDDERIVHVANQDEAKRLQSK